MECWCIFLENDHKSFVILSGVISKIRINITKGDLLLTCAIRRNVCMLVRQRGRQRSVQFSAGCLEVLQQVAAYRVRRMECNLSSGSRGRAGHTGSGRSAGRWAALLSRAVLYLTLC